MWQVDLNLPTDALRALWDSLAMDERERAERFHAERDRRQYVAARGALRSILAGYLHDKPAHLQFCYGPTGKPALSRDFTDVALEFSLSHSGGVMLCAVTSGHQVGVDIERLRSNLAYERLADAYFAPVEARLLRDVPQERRLAAFFQLWTCKEAFLKAKGLGLTMPMDQFEVDLASTEGSLLRRCLWDVAESARWMVRPLELAPDFAAALAVGGFACPVRRWRWCGLS